MTRPVIIATRPSRARPCVSSESVAMPSKPRKESTAIDSAVADEAGAEAGGVEERLRRELGPAGALR